MGARASVNRRAFAPRASAEHERVPISITTPPLRFGRRCAKPWPRPSLRRQSVLGACRGQGVEGGDRSRAGEGGGAGRRAAGGCDLHQRRQRGECARARRAGRARPGIAICRRWSILRCSPAAGSIAKARPPFPSRSDGVIDREMLAKELAKHHLGGWRPFVSLMAANNETGAIQPVAEAAEIVHAAGGLFHTDAVQAAGRICARFRARSAPT